MIIFQLFWTGEAVNKSLKTLIAGGAAMAAVWMGSGTAFADGITDYGNSYSDVYVTTAYGHCEASIELTGTNQDYVDSSFWGDNTQTLTCHFWIQRGQKDSSGSYLMTNLYAQDVALGPTPNADNYWKTGQYWDGPGYRAQACFYMTDNSGWTGSTHCTDPI